MTGRARPAVGTGAQLPIVTFDLVAKTRGTLHLINRDPSRGAGLEKEPSGAPFQGLTQLPPPPTSTFYYGFIFGGEVVDPALFMSAVKQTSGRSRNAEIVCCFGFMRLGGVVVVGGEGGCFWSLPSAAAPQQDHQP